MSNKLKNIFNSAAYELKGTLRFRDEESSRRFGEALEQVYNDGKTVQVDGVEAVLTDIQDGDARYPLSYSEVVDRFTVGPSGKSVTIKINGSKTVALTKYESRNETVIENSPDAVIRLRFIYKTKKQSMTMSFHTQIENAMSISGIAEELSDAIGILNFFFKTKEKTDTDQEREQYDNFLRSLQFTADFYDRLSAVEKELGETFDPKMVGTIDDIAEDVYELYLLLVEKRPVRLNAKLTSTSTTGIEIKNDLFEHKIGAALDLTFRNEALCIICGKEIHLYTANLLTNAIVKEISTGQDGTVHLLYGDTESKPMYISYTGFQDEQACRSEFDDIMKHKESYVNAQTVEHFIAACVSK